VKRSPESRAAAKAQKRADIERAIVFLEKNPWLQVMLLLVLNDYLRYAGVISKSKSSDLGVIIAGLGVGMNGGGVSGTALAALAGGAFEFFPDDSPIIGSSEFRDKIKSFFDKFPLLVA